MATERKKPVSEGEMERQARTTGERLAAQPRVRIRIAPDRRDPASSVVPVSVNGYLYYINRAQSVEVPQTVAEILGEAGYL